MKERQQGRCNAYYEEGRNIANMSHMEAYRSVKLKHIVEGLHSKREGAIESILDKIAVTKVKN